MFAYKDRKNFLQKEKIFLTRNNEILIFEEEENYFIINWFGSNSKI